MGIVINKKCGKLTGFLRGGKVSPKITADMLVFIISAFCGFKDGKISRDQKEACAEMMVNCAIVQDGYSTNIIVDECKTRWAEIERKNRVQGR